MSSVLFSLLSLLSLFSRTVLPCSLLLLFWFGLLSAHSLSAKIPQYSKFKYFGFRGILGGEFRYPADIALGVNNEIWVSDWKNNRLQVFSNKGQFQRELGNGSFTLKLDGPVGLAFLNRSSLFISLMNGSRVVEVSPTEGKIIQSIGRSGKKHGFFNHPRGISIYQKEKLVIADTDNSRVEIFDLKGNYLETFKFRDREGKAMKPRGVLTTNDDSILVSFSSSGKLVNFNLSGEILWEIGSEKKLFQEPRYMAQDFLGNYYVSDFGLDRIVKLNSAGNFIEFIGRKGSKPGNLNNPEGLFLDRHGDLYIADSGNDRCQIFQVSEPVREFNSGFRYFKKKKFSKAIEHYEKFLVFDPGNEVAIEQLILCLKARGDYHLAQKNYSRSEYMYRQVLNYDPENRDIPKKIDEIFWLSHRKTFEKTGYILTFLALFLILISFIQMRFFRKKRK